MGPQWNGSRAELSWSVRGLININKLSAPQQVNRCPASAAQNLKRSLRLGLGLGPVVFAVDHKSDSLGLQQEIWQPHLTRDILRNFRHSNSLRQLHASCCSSILNSCLDIRYRYDLWRCGQILDRFLSSPVKYPCILRFISCFLCSFWLAALVPWPTFIAVKCQINVTTCPTTFDVAFDNVHLEIPAGDAVCAPVICLAARTLDMMEHCQLVPARHKQKQSTPRDLRLWSGEGVGVVVVEWAIGGGATAGGLTGRRCQCVGSCRTRVHAALGL